MREIKFRVWQDDKGYNRMVHFWLNGVPKEFDISFYPVMQYTGLKDKNGVEIFEGDIIDANIIEHSISTMGQVVFCDEYSTYANRNLAGDTFLWKLDRIKVRGNIYENPELLKS